MSGDARTIEFGGRLLELLDRGSFTATYKYAVLLGLIDLCLEHAGRRGQPPESVTTRQLAENVVQAYWLHSVPYDDGRVLRQNKGSQAEILSLIARFRSHVDDPSASTTRARMSDTAAWERLVTDVEWVLVEMPLPRLQVLGASEDRFIYEVRWTRDGITRSEFRDTRRFDNVIRFVGGAQHHLVRLASLLRPLLKREWAAQVAAINALPEARLEEFLFGATRRPPGTLVRALRELQLGKCFYCVGGLGVRTDVDHFIPWSRHPDDQIENLVLADRACNGAKSDHLADAEHVRRWVRRASDLEARLADVAKRHEWEHAPGRSVATARGIYYNLASAVPLWSLGTDFVALDRAGLDRAFS